MARKGLLVLKYFGKLAPHQVDDMRSSMSNQLREANMVAIILDDAAKWEVYAAVDPSDEADD